MLANDDFEARMDEIRDHCQQAAERDAGRRFRRRIIWLAIIIATLWKVWA